ncbi:ABC transporter permease subunit [Candidatus Merdisoma sp. JLR.KK011]|uniref:ABC transporter permease subunit n=1 Tax=Candidatus Merdisoma sp. JLR.KK011 TaxID=3114299 RepID=UPI002FF2BEE6
MMRLIRFEFEKIVNKKIVYAVIAFILIMGCAMCTGRGAGAQIVRKPDGSYLEGREAVRYDKEIAAEYEGVLTEEKVEEILKTYSPNAEDGSFWGINNIYNSLVSHWGEMDGTYDGTDVLSEFPNYRDDRPMVLGYNEGWLSFLETGAYMMIFIGCLLVIALAPVFSEEYTRGTDALILTSRHGKRKCAWAKIIASYLFTFLSVGVWLLFQSFVYWKDFGLDGSGGSVQINNHFLFYDVPYFLTNMGAAGYCLILWIGGSLILTALVLLLSALCRSSFAAVIAALACYALPSTLGQMGVPAEILSLNPTWDFLMETPMTIPKLSLMGGVQVSYVWVTAAFGLGMSVLSFVLCRRIFAKHQVT